MSIMVRAALTPKEWRALRKLSIDRNVATSELIADALRKSRSTAQALRDAA